MLQSFDESFRHSLIILLRVSDVSEHLRQRLFVVDLNEMLVFGQ